MCNIIAYDLERERGCDRKGAIHPREQPDIAGKDAAFSRKLVSLFQIIIGSKRDRKWKLGVLTTELERQPHTLPAMAL